MGTAAAGDVVILLGCPAPSDAAFWQPLRAVVSGRLVNGFSRQDGVLRYLHRIEVGVEKTWEVGGGTSGGRTGGDRGGGRGERGSVGGGEGARRLLRGSCGWCWREWVFAGVFVRIIDGCTRVCNRHQNTQFCIANKEDVKRINMTDDGEMTNKRCARFTS